MIHKNNETESLEMKSRQKTSELESAENRNTERAKLLSERQDEIIIIKTQSMLIWQMKTH